VIEELRALGVAHEAVAWDHRAHGASARPPLPLDWWDAARDALAVAGQVDGPLVGVGHSLGAAVLLMAEILAPGRFEAIVAVEPIVFPPPYAVVDHHPLAVGARRRRPEFPTRADALDNFASKPVFARWDRRALEAYVECGLVADGDDRVLLSCPPEYEAAFFAAAGVHGAWERLGEVGAPVRVVAGRDSDSHPAEFAAEQAGRIPNATLEIVDDSGHFLPMEQPARLAAVIAHTIESIRAS
jgi:pimeloyl-ACP methyl ester carboxylesterase